MMQVSSVADAQVNCRDVLFLTRVGGQAVVDWFSERALLPIRGASYSIPSA